LPSISLKTTKNENENNNNMSRDIYLPFSQPNNPRKASNIRYNTTNYDFD